MTVIDVGDEVALTEEFRGLPTGSVGEVTEVLNQPSSVFEGLYQVRFPDPDNTKTSQTVMVASGMMERA